MTTPNDLKAKFDRVPISRGMLAKRAGVTPDTLHKIVHGRLSTVPRIDTVARIVLASKVDGKYWLRMQDFLPEGLREEVEARIPTIVDGRRKPRAASGDTAA